jgi:hypothetical protein
MKRIFEYKNFNNLSNKELLEMSNITYKTTGIKNVVLWIGPNTEYHGKRIKVSNIPNKFDKISRQDYDKVLEINIKSPFF